jgi:serine/threonine protein kinase
MVSASSRCPTSTSCTGLHLFDPQIDPKDRIRITYDDWLEEQGKMSSSSENTYAYLRDRYLCIHDNDPCDCPGLHRAAELIAYCDLGKLKKKHQEELRQCLNRIYVEHQMRGLFLVGNEIGEGWEIVSQISDAVGYFNWGIYICRDLTREHEGGGVLKVLPTWQDYPDYGSREIHILEVLEGVPNIIQMHEYYEPDYNDLAPWVITDYCDGGTLQNLTNNMSKGKRCVPELFLWHVFESLLTAAHACHTGYPTWHQRTWDPIYHRDIILGNIFLMSSKSPSDSYPTVVLADFGCAIAQGEVEERGFKPEDLPEECPSSIPPEGPVASASADVWQIGHAVSRLAEDTWLTHLSGNDKAADSSEFRSLVSLLTHIDGDALSYMWNLRQLLTLCMAVDPRDRPTAGELLGEVKKRRAKLVETGELMFEPLASS